MAAVGGRGDGDGLVAAWICVGVCVGVEEEVMVVVVVIVDVYVGVAKVEGCCETRQRRGGLRWRWRM